MAVAITRTDLPTEELRGAARRTTDTYQARRLYAADGEGHMAGAQLAQAMAWLRPARRR